MMKAHGFHKIALLAAFGTALGAPVAANADPAAGSWSGDAAAPVPHIPGPFTGAPTNDDPNNGEFSLTFDSTGRLVQVGRASEPPGTIEVAPLRLRAQAYARSSADAATENTFTTFRTQLRSLGHAPRTSVTAQR